MKDCIVATWFSYLIQSFHLWDVIILMGLLWLNYTCKIYIFSNRVVAIVVTFAWRHAGYPMVLGSSSQESCEVDSHWDSRNCAQDDIASCGQGSGPRFYQVPKHLQFLLHHKTGLWFSFQYVCVDAHFRATSEEQLFIYWQSSFWAMWISVLSLPNHAICKKVSSELSWRI